MLRKIILALAAACGFMVFEAQAWEEKRPQVMVGETEYIRSHIWVDFLDVVFSETVWNEDVHMWSSKPDKFSLMLEWYSNKNTEFTNDKTKKEYEQRKHWMPWYADYIYKPDGWPRHNVLHKWEGEITIGMGWPSYSPGNFETGSNKGSPLGNNRHTETDNPSQYYPVISEEVKKLIPILEKQTNLKTKLIAVDDPRDSTPNYARIRIIPAYFFEAGGRSWLEHHRNVDRVSDHEPWLWGGVLFETSDLLHMDGFMLPNPDDTPGLVVCKIMVVGVAEELFRALVRECLVRAVGLPDISRTSADSVLSDWRNSLVTDVLNPTGDQKGIDFSKETFLAPVPPTGGMFSEVFERMGKNGLKFLPYSITPYDELMIGLLYCPAFKSGMDKHQAIQILTGSDECVSKLLKSMESIH